MTSLREPTPPGDRAGLTPGDGVLGGDSCVEVGGFPASAADACCLLGWGLPGARPPGDTGRSRAGDADGTEVGPEESRPAVEERPGRPGVSTVLGVSLGGGVGLWFKGIDDEALGEADSRGDDADAEADAGEDEDKAPASLVSSLFPLSSLRLSLSALPGEKEDKYKIIHPRSAPGALDKLQQR